MCGIFGFLSTPKSGIKKSEVLKIVDTLYILSESRGKESAGISIKNYYHQAISVFKKSVPASELIKSNEYKTFLQQSLDGCFDTQYNLMVPISIIGHARLVTNGTQENNNNNQPVIKDNWVAVHNGIITNVDNLWEKYAYLNRIYEVDTEIFLSLLNTNILNNLSIQESIKNVFNEIEGTASVACQSAMFSKFILATNNGSLYYTYNTDRNIFIFASEKYILQECLKRLLKNYGKIIWLKSKTGLVIDEENFKIEAFDFTKNSTLSVQEERASKNFSIINHTPDKPVDFEAVKDYYYQLKTSPLQKLLEYNIEEIKQLKRCTKCLLPETFPFIEFDDKGECNYCKHYIVRNMGSREKEFKEILDRYRSKDGSPDCLVPFSGGRDSSFGLHYIVHELKMHPITYTYDWGMVTDLARRNIARVCGKLGIENILVSADIRKKRRNIKLNVEAWLKNPQLGLVPLFMAGDKQFFYYVNQVKKQTGIKLDIWSTNYLENTDFKVGFCNVKPTFDKHRPDYLPLSSKVKMAWYYLKNFLINPAYINSSIFDTLFSFYAYYAEPRIHFYQLYDWVKWDEERITDTLINEYNWEFSPDTKSTWRIGDGTAAFYNYIYYTVAGFSEIDTFRSNQIREGLITREEGMKKIFEENAPRFESLKWYLDIIGVDFERAIRIINKIPKLYRK